jgi:hypothetical protein
MSKQRENSTLISYYRELAKFSTQEALGEALADPARGLPSVSDTTISKWENEGLSNPNRVFQLIELFVLREAINDYETAQRMWVDWNKKPRDEPPELRLLFDAEGKRVPVEPAPPPPEDPQAGQPGDPSARPPMILVAVGLPFAIVALVVIPIVVLAGPWRWIQLWEIGQVGGVDPTQPVIINLVPLGSEPDLLLQLRSMEGEPFASPTVVRVGQNLEVVFEIRNDSAYPVHISELEASGRYGRRCAEDDEKWASGGKVGFPPVMNVTLQPGETYIYRSQRAYYHPGHYFIEPVHRPTGGQWGGFSPSACIDIEVRP